MKILRLTLVLALLVTSFVCVGVVEAQIQPMTAAVTDGSGGAKTPDGSGGAASQQKSIPKLENPIYADNVQELLYTIVDLAILIGVIIATFVFIFIGFKFVMAQGDPAALTKARSWFLSAVIGTALLLGAKVIMEVIKNTLTSAGVVNEKLFNKP